MKGEIFLTHPVLTINSNKAGKDSKRREQKVGPAIPSAEKCSFTEWQEVGRESLTNCNHACLGHYIFRFQRVPLFYMKILTLYHLRKTL